MTYYLKYIKYRKSKEKFKAKNQHGSKIMELIINIKKGASHSDLEKALTTIYQSKGKNITLILPKRIILNSNLGIDFLVISLIFTLLKRQNDTPITFISPYNEKDQYKYENLYGLYSHIYFHKIVTTHNKDLQKAESTTQYLQSMFIGEYKKVILKNKAAKTLELLSIQGTKFEYPSYIFTSNYEFGKRVVKNRGDIETEIYRILSCFKSNNASKIHISPPYFSKITIASLAILTQELFKNIEEHAKSDQHGNIYTENLPSGLRFQHSKFDEKQLLSNMKGIWPTDFLNYLKNNNTSTSKSYIPIFELSIFDSGPGLARKWLKKEFDEFSISEEEEATLKCFQKHATTKSDSNRYGIGLSEVLGCIKRHRGAIHIRTGRLLLIHAFHSDFNDKNPIIWQVTHFINSPIDGTIISIFIPFAN
jgi:hypothetical protein